MANYRHVTHEGRTLCLKDWARELGMNYGTLITRLHRGWSVERALNPNLERNPAGTGCIDRGYRKIRGRGEHRAFAEDLIGKPLPSHAVIHHVNGNTLEHKGNIVICENHSYHRLLHWRHRALVACGNPNARICRYCKQYDDMSHLTKYRSDKSFHHKHCRRQYRRKTTRR